MGPHGYKSSKEEIQRIFEQGPPIIYIQDVRIPKRRENSVKRESLAFSAILYPVPPSIIAQKLATVCDDTWMQQPDSAKLVPTTRES